MAPASNWVADYGEDSCALRRVFSAGEDRVTLELSQMGPGDVFHVSVVSGTLARSNALPRVRFEPDPAFVAPQSPALVGNRDLRGVTYKASLRAGADKPDPSQPQPDWPTADREAREKSVTGLWIAESFRRTLLLETGSMHEPMTAMRACIDELVTHWGLDPAALRTLSRPPAPVDQRVWQRRVLEAYPDAMARDNRGGTVHIRLILGSDGRPTTCLFDKARSHPTLAQPACDAIVKHGRFAPALDASGQPIASYWATTVEYFTR